MGVYELQAWCAGLVPGLAEPTPLAWEDACGVEPGTIESEGGTIFGRPLQAWAAHWGTLAPVQRAAVRLREFHGV